MLSSAMKRLAAFLLFLFAAVPSLAQTTLVTAQIKDPAGIPYAGAQLKAQLTTPGATVTINNAAQCASAGQGSAPCNIPIQGTSGPVTLDPQGNIPGGGLVMFDNTFVNPAATQWIFTVSIAPGVAPPLGTGPQSFSVTLTISGAAQTISTAINAAAPSLANGSLGPGPSTPGIPPTNGAGTIYASNYGVKGGGIRFCDAAWGNGVHIVTINNTTGFVDPPFTSLMNGWIVFGTNQPCASSSATVTTVQVPLGTLSVASTGNTATVSTTTTAPCTSTAGSAICSLLIFPQDDTTAWQNAWNAAVATCPNTEGATLVMPLTLSAVSLPIKGPTTSQCGVNNISDGLPMYLTVQGGGMSGSVIVPLPSLNAANCDANNGCFFTNPAAGSQQNGMRFRDFSIDGGGNQAVQNPSNRFALAGAANSIFDHVAVTGWGIGDCIATNGSDGAGVFLHHVQLSACSTWDLLAGNATYIDHSKIFWSPQGGLASFNCNEVFGDCVSSYNQYEFGCVGSMIQVVSGASSETDFVNDHIDGPCANNQAYIEVLGGSTRLTNVTMDNPSATSDIGLKVDPGATAYVHNSRFLLNANSGIGISNAGLIFLSGEMVNSSITPFSGTNPYIGSMVFQAIGTGTCTASSTLFLNAANSAVNACTNTTATTVDFLTPSAGMTLSNLVCSATTGGVNASSGVVTVRSAPLSTGTFSNSLLSATFGTGTTASDLSHTLNAAANTPIQIQITTQAAETLAGVACSLIFHN